MKALTAGLAVALLAACANPPMPVQLQGDPVSIAWLAGTWSGEYWGGASGRHGTLGFDLRSGTDSLFGEVLMMDPMGNLVRSADTDERHRQHVQSVRNLRIDFVRAHADTVRGMLEPYVAPECDCTVTTSFLGLVRGDVIEGTFETRGGAGIRQQGFWRMKRTGAGQR